jgi:hypothetical protein
MFWKRYNDPFGVYGNMPEIPKDYTHFDDDDIHTIGCLHALIFLIAMAAGVCIIIALSLII